MVFRTSLLGGQGAIYASLEATVITADPAKVSLRWRAFAVAKPPRRTSTKDLENTGHDFKRQNLIKKNKFLCDN